MSYQHASAVSWGETDVSCGEVRVTRQVVGYSTVRSESKRREAETALSLPPRTLATTAVWWTIPDEHLAAADRKAVSAGRRTPPSTPPLRMLPLFATCDRWDVGGLSTELHPATGRLTVFVYDGHEGGAGFAERGFGAAADWLRATRDAIASCPCETGCPSCVQSPKCGNGNYPLYKEGAVTLLRVLLYRGRIKREPALAAENRAAPAGESGGRRAVRPWGGRPAPF